MLFIGLTLLPTSLELWGWISYYSWIWEWWRCTVSCSSFYSVCHQLGKPGAILVRIDNLFVEFWSPIDSSEALGWACTVYFDSISPLVDAEYNISQIDLFCLDGVTTSRITLAFSHEGDETSVHCSCLRCHVTMYSYSLFTIPYLWRLFLAHRNIMVHVTVIQYRSSLEGNKK